MIKDKPEELFDERIKVKGGIVHVKCRFPQDVSLPENFRAVVREHAGKLTESEGEHALRTLIVLNFHEVVVEVVKFFPDVLPLPTDLQREMRLRPQAQS